jgi:hypothetical protein
LCIKYNYFFHAASGAAAVLPGACGVFGFHFFLKCFYRCCCSLFWRWWRFCLSFIFIFLLFEFYFYFCFCFIFPPIFFLIFPQVLLLFVLALAAFMFPLCDMLTIIGVISFFFLSTLLFFSGGVFYSCSATC